MGLFQEIIVNNIQESIATKQKLLDEPTFVQNIEKAGFLLADTLEQGKKILFCGNGGSAADAQHIAAELVVRFKPNNNRLALPAITLSPDPSTITAIGNDYGYQFLFSRTLEAWGQAGDCLVAISTSGQSENVIQAIEAARKKPMKVVALLGKDGGRMKGMADIEIIVPSYETGRIQESHIMIGHILCSIIEKKMFNLD